MKKESGNFCLFSSFKFTHNNSVEFNGIHASSSGNFRKWENIEFFFLLIFDFVICHSVDGKVLS